MAWTSPTTRTTGTLITASIWNTDIVDNLIYLKGVADQVDGVNFVYKSADESLNTSTTLQNDDALVFPVSANKTYHFSMVLYVNAVNVTMDFKCGWTVPASATMAWGHYGAVGAVGAPAGALGVVNVGSSVDPVIVESGTLLIGTVAGNSIAKLEGLAFIAGTSGNVQFQWTQNTSNGSNLTVKAGSFLQYTLLN